MPATTPVVADVFSAREIAAAAGVSAAEVRRLIGSGELPTLDGRFVGTRQAVAAVRRLRSLDSGIEAGERRLFAPPPAARRSPGRALAASGLLHGAMLGALALVTSLGLSDVTQQEPRESTPVRLVFLATPGPGGGGGGGGLRQPAPPPKAQMKGKDPLKSPVPPPRRQVAKAEAKARVIPPPPVRPRPVEQPREPAPAPPPPEKPMPQVVAPVVTAPADPRDRAGVLAESSSEAESQGTGTGGGAGTGSGTGIGEGDGSGIGPGSGGGTGGGPYRPGSGITPPGLLKEVRPDYTEEARRRGIQGEVVVEVVVRRDGTVGDVRLVEGLGAGLDQRAIDAVRQWRFSPARRHGTPVDVMVEVAVEFKLR